MKTMTAIVADSKRLELSEDVAIPAGTRVRIRIEEVEAPDDYGVRLTRYYQNSTDEALEEERSLAEQLSAGDASLAAEEPWW